LPKEQLHHIKLIINAAGKNIGFIPNFMLTMARNPANLGSFGMLTANIIRQGWNYISVDSNKNGFQEYGMDGQKFKK